MEEKEKKRMSLGLPTTLYPTQTDNSLIYTDVMGIMTKTCTICEVEIYSYLQPSICQFMMLHTKP